jgi:hypothetical protein
VNPKNIACGHHLMTPAVSRDLDAMALREQIKVEWDPQVQVTEIVAQRWADAGLAVARSRGIRSLHPGHAVGNRVDVRPVTPEAFWDIYLGRMVPMGTGQGEGCGR